MAGKHPRQRNCWAGNSRQAAHGLRGVWVFCWGGVGGWGRMTGQLQLLLPVNIPVNTSVEPRLLIPDPSLSHSSSPVPLFSTGSSQMWELREPQGDLCPLPCQKSFSSGHRPANISSISSGLLALLKLTLLEVGQACLAHYCISWT